MTPSPERLPPPERARPWSVSRWEVWQRPGRVVAAIVLIEGLEPLPRAHQILRQKQTRTICRVRALVGPASCVSRIRTIIMVSSPPLPPGDILIHAGDLTKRGTEGEVDSALAGLDAAPHAHKIVVAGNHDIALASE